MTTKHLSDRFNDREFDTIPLSAIEDNPGNARTTYEGIEDLADSLATVGLIEPVTVSLIQVPGPGSDGKYRLIAGHRRVRAARHAGWTKIDAQICHQPSEYDSLTENTARAELTPAETASKVFDLRKSGKTVKEIAKASALSEPHVRNLIRVREKACPELWDLFAGERTGGLRGDTLTFKRAVELCALSHDRQRAAIAAILGSDQPATDPGEVETVEGEAAEADTVESPPPRDLRPRAIDRRTLSKYLAALVDAKRLQPKGEKDPALSTVITTLRWVMGEREAGKPPVPWPDSDEG
jgi:ParB/RepB/Spo0J family partition protein